LMEEVLPGSGVDFSFSMILVIRFLPLEKGSGCLEFGFARTFGDGLSGTFMKL
jgi:hypothetical protein